MSCLCPGAPLLCLSIAMVRLSVYDLAAFHWRTVTNPRNTIPSLYSRTGLALKSTSNGPCMSSTSFATTPFAARRPRSVDSRSSTISVCSALSLPRICDIPFAQIYCPAPPALYYEPEACHSQASTSTSKHTPKLHLITIELHSNSDKRSRDQLIHSSAQELCWRVTSSNNISKANS